METATLFNQATARRDDPIQSHIAADKMNKSYTVLADRIQVLTWIARSPGMTAKQIDVVLEGKAHRRAGELETLGLITRDKSGSEMKLYITEKGQEILMEIIQESS